jgi:hypothetical protein
MSLNRSVEVQSYSRTLETQPFDEAHITRGAVKQHILVQVVLRQTKYSIAKPDATPKPLAMAKKLVQLV